jgi:hypothetical protein
MEPCFDQGSSSFDLAGDVLAQAALRLKSDERSFRSVPVSFLERCLQGTKFLSVHSLGSIV